MNLHRFAVPRLLHRVHHIRYSFGWLLFPSMRRKRKLGFFPWFGLRWMTNPFRIVEAEYHDCTATGVH